MVVCAPAAMVKGKDGLLNLNPAPDELIFEMDNEVVPELVSVIDLVTLPPIVTLPKLTLAGLAESVAVPAGEPVPLKLTASGKSEALLAIEIVPVKLPCVAGLKSA